MPRLFRKVDLTKNGLAHHHQIIELIWQPNMIWLYEHESFKVWFPPTKST